MTRVSDNRRAYGRDADREQLCAVPGMSFNADVLSALDLAQFLHWVCWRYVWRPDKAKPDKVPMQPRTGRNADITNPAHWASLDDAIRRAEREGWGVGFVFHETLNPFAGVDLDGARDPHTGELAPWAQSIVAAFDSYAEVSPSGTGVKIVVRGKPRHNGSWKGAGGTAIEVYGTARFFTLTGLDVVSLPIRDGQHMLDALCDRLWPIRPAPASRPRRLFTASDATIIRRARAAKNGALFDALWSGNWRGRYDSPSEADLALCSLLSFWCDADASRVDHLFRQSGLSRPKWEQREDYRARTLARACQLRGRAR